MVFQIEGAQKTNCVILAIVGSGNVGTALFDVFSAVAEINRIFWYSRNPNEGQLLLDHHIPAEVDLVFLAVPDGEIDHLAGKLLLQSEATIVVHLSGATSSSVLAKYFHNFGVFYPVQTIRKGATLNWIEIPICIHGNEESLEKIYKLATTISNNARFVGDDARLNLHLGAVMVNNFTNHLAVLTKDFLENKNVEFALLNAIIKESALKLTQESPDFTQTGPAKRKDYATISRHEALLNNDVELLKLYSVITESIINYYHKK